MSRGAPICVISAACAGGEWTGAAGQSAGHAAECVCRDQKAQGFGLREGRCRGATLRVRVGDKAPASHYDINL